jgi:predicted amidohydrolase YtcJ
MSATDALRGYTVGPAAAAGMAGTLGAVAPGAAGDLAVWDGDPLAMRGADWLALRCLATVVGGEVVYTQKS